VYDVSRWHAKIADGLICNDLQKMGEENGGIQQAKVAYRDADMYTTRIPEETFSPRKVTQLVEG
jgi:hypothetical protein